MKNQVYNPYLPLYEYNPDVEPHVFDGRVYVYGSHDKFGSHGFCVNDYVAWSAPVEDLSDWRYDGVIFRRGEDPDNKRKAALYAPDVCKAPDGRYYLYYSPAPGVGKKTLYIAVAVSDTPQGPFTYHGRVNLDKWIKKFVPFDPAVYVENGRVWLYYGSGIYPPLSLYISKKGVLGGAVVELNPDDMCSVIGEPVITVPLKHTDENNSFGEHVFFEASSMRKIKDKYYFIYSSALGHELCYAIGETPTGPFSFGGTLVSNGNIGIGSHKDPVTACNYTGNTHGSILELNDKYYIFYHRHTNRHDFSRQGCAERIYLDENGKFEQAEITSCGLNDGALSGKGIYPAGILCYLTSRKGARFYGVFRGIKLKEPYLTQTGHDREENADQYVANIRSGTTVGYKYFDLTATSTLEIYYSGRCDGKFIVKTQIGGKPMTEIRVSGRKNIRVSEKKIPHCGAKSALYLEYCGRGYVNLHAIELS